MGDIISVDLQIEFAQSEVIDAVMASGALGVSKHQKLLFKYLIKYKYNNNIDKVKAYNIAVDVFGRSADFDSSVDSIVRVEMFRLRANLKAFNQDAEKFHLVLPKASYEIEIKPLVTPELDNTLDEGVNGDLNNNQRWFKRVKNAAILVAISTVGVITFIAGKSGADWRAETDCSNLVPNVAIVNNSASSELGIYIGEVLRGAASQFTHLNVVKDIENCRYTDVPGYEIQHTLFQSGDSFRSTLTAVSDYNKKTVISQNFSGELENGVFSNDFYYKLVRVTNDWLKPEGIIHSTAVIAPWENKEKQRDYSCVAIMYDYFISDSDEAYQASMDCYLKSYEQKTPLLDNLGGLAANYFEQVLGVRAHTVDNPYNAAVKIMEEVGDNWPKGVETTVAKIMWESEREDFNAERLRNTLYRAEKIYDSNSSVLAEVAKHYGFKLGDWENAKRISEHSQKLTSARDNSSYLIDASYALLFDKPETVLNACQKVYSENSKIATLLVHACSLKANDKVWIKRTESNLIRFGLGEPSKRIEFLNELKWHDTFIHALAENQ